MLCDTVYISLSQETTLGCRALAGHPLYLGLFLGTHHGMPWTARSAMVPTTVHGANDLFVYGEMEEAEPYLETVDI